MANIKSNAKRNKQNIKKALINKSAKNRMKTLIKKSMLTKDKAITNEATKVIQSNCSKGIVKKNKANKLVSKIHFNLDH